MPETPGRDARGYFAPGNTLGRQGGNPHVKRMASYKTSLLNCGSDADVQTLYKALMDAAKGGDVQAAKLLLDHLCGRPTQSADININNIGTPANQATKLTAIFLQIIGDDAEKRERFAAALRDQSALTVEVANGSDD